MQTESVWDDRRCHYLLIDGALVPDLKRHIYHLAGEESPVFVTLLQDFFADETDDQLPLLIQAQADSELYDYFQELLRSSPAGCILSSAVAIETLAEHCNSLMIVTYDSHRPSFFRFYDPRNLGALREVFAESLPSILGPIDRLTWHHRGRWQSLTQAQPWSGVLHPRGWLQVEAEELAAIERIKHHETVEKLAETYHEVITAQGVEPQPYVAQQVELAKGQGFHQLSQLERWLRLALIQGGSFWQLDEAQMLLNNHEFTMEHKLTQLEQLLGAQS